MRSSGWALASVLVVACGRHDTKPSGSTADGPLTPRSAAPAAPSGGPLQPVLRDGDIVFQESGSPQSDMIHALTRSRWTHMGVLFVEAAGPEVLEASSKVRFTPLAEWAKQGRGGHYVVKRVIDAAVRLRPEVWSQVRAVGKRFVGLPYDARFQWGDDALYCSELVYKLFEQGATMHLGKIEHPRDLDLADPKVQAALATRFAPGAFNPEEAVVTPRSIFDDAQLVTVMDE